MADEYGVQDDGSFKKKPVDVIREEVKQDFKNEIGTDIELRPSSPIIQVINAAAIELSKQWNALESVYYVGFFEDTFGQQLDKQLALAGFQRKPLRGATGVVEFTVETPPGRIIDIPEGTVIEAPSTKTRPRIPFRTIESASIGASDTSSGEVEIAAVAPWETDVDSEYLGEATNLSADTITQFANAQPDLDAVTNPVATGTGRTEFTEGRDKETDAEFKNRYLASFAEAGDATPDAVNAQVFNADPNIQSVKVTEIHDPTADDYGVKVSVLAPNAADDTIAQAVYDSRAAGLESFGSNSGTAIDDDGEEHIEKFERANKQPIEIEIGLTTDSSFPSDGETQIKNRLVRYIGGEDTEGVSFPGNGIGENVVFDQVFRRIINQQGVVELTLNMGEKDTTLDKDNVPIGDLEAAEVSPTDITFL